MERERRKEEGGKEKYKQRERDVQTKKGGFLEMDNRNCCFQRGCGWC